MDTPELPDALKEAGQAYYDALRKLGFDPEGLLWVYNYKDEDFRLWLVWSGLDHYGPLAISKMLFKAYNAAALPKDVDPFSVYVVNPEHLVGELSKRIALHSKEDPNVDTQMQITEDEAGRVPFMLTENNWIYHLQTKRFNNKKINRDWRAFSKNVEALAA